MSAAAGKPATAAEARDATITWQHTVGNRAMSWSEVAEWGDYWERVAERWPELLDEFAENGII